MYRNQGFTHLVAGSRPLLLAVMLALILPLAVAGPAQAGPGKHLKRGIKLLNDMEDAGALKAFERALGDEKTDKDRATIHIYMGIAHFNLLDKEAAKKSFETAMKLDPQVQLPEMTSPKIRDFFQQMRTEQPKEPAAQGGAKGPGASSRPTPATRPGPLPPRRRRSSSINWPAWITLGLAVAAGGTGLAMGLLSLSEESKSQDMSLVYEDAESHYDRAVTDALVANIMFGVAGAAAITSVVFFIVGHKKAKAERTAATAVTAATVVPVPSGVVVQIGGVTW